MTDNTNIGPVIDEAPEATQDALSGNREAARYRRQLRDTEAARDALQGRVAALTKHAVDVALQRGFATAADGRGIDLPYRLRHIGDLAALGGVTTDALIGDDGLPDEAKVAEALTALHGTRPELFDLVRMPGRGAHVPDPTQGQGTPPRDLGEEWAGAFGPRS